METSQLRSFGPFIVYLQIDSIVRNNDLCCIVAKKNTAPDAKSHFLVRYSPTWHRPKLLNEVIHHLLTCCATTVCGLLIFGQGLVFASCGGYNRHIHMWNDFLWSVSAQRNSRCLSPFQFQSEKLTLLLKTKKENCYVQFLLRMPWPLLCT